MKRFFIRAASMFILAAAGTAFAATTVLDDFNRADGGLGPNWTVQDGAFAIAGNVAVGSSGGLAIYNGVSSRVVEVDVALVNGASVQYAGVVLDYASLVSNIFVKVQNNDSPSQFDRMFCYLGNNGSDFGSPYYFDLTPAFTTAHMRVERVGSDIVTTFTNIDNGPGTQFYTCPGAPVTGGTGVGLVGFAGGATGDNFAIERAGPPAGVPTLTQSALVILGGLLVLSALALRRRG